MLHPIQLHENERLVSFSPCDLVPLQLNDGLGFVGNPDLNSMLQSLAAATDHGLRMSKSVQEAHGRLQSIMGQMSIKTKDLEHKVTALESSTDYLENSQRLFAFQTISRFQQIDVQIEELRRKCNGDTFASSSSLLSLMTENVPNGVTAPYLLSVNNSTNHKSELAEVPTGTTWPSTSFPSLAENSGSSSTITQGNLYICIG